MIRLHALYLLSGFSGFYSGVIKTAVGLWLKDYGMELIFLGLLNITLLPFSLKIFWIPFFDTWRSPFDRIFGHRKGWLVTFAMIIPILSLGFILFDPQKNFMYLIAYATFYAACIATHEAMALGYQMETIAREEWGPREGVVMVAWHFGFWFGGGGLLFASQYVPWGHLFIISSTVMLLGGFWTMCIPDSDAVVRKVEGFSEKFITPYKDFIVGNRRILFSLIAFIALYRLQDRILSSMMTYFFMDIGCSKNLIAGGKSVGFVAMAIGGLLGSSTVKNFGYHKSLIFGVFFHAISTILFITQAVLPINDFLFYFSLILEKLVRGFEGTIFFTYQMTFCNKQFAMSQIVILSAIDRLSGNIFGSFSGFIVEFFGWIFFFIISFIGSLPSLIFLKKLPRIGSSASEEAEKIRL